MRHVDRNMNGKSCLDKYEREAMAAWALERDDIIQDVYGFCAEVIELLPDLPPTGEGFQTSHKLFVSSTQSGVHAIDALASVTWGATCAKLRLAAASVHESILHLLDIHRAYWVPEQDVLDRLDLGWDLLGLIGQWYGRLFSLTVPRTERTKS